LLVDAGPERGVQLNRVVMRGEAGCHLGVDLAKARIAVAIPEIGERQLNTRQQLAAAFEGHDRILKSGGPWIAGDSRYFV
jgi:negative regulator of sigma E activity